MIFAKLFFIFATFIAISTAKVIITSGTSDLLQSILEDEAHIMKAADSLYDYRKYVAGNRVNGDYVVGHSAKNQRYQTPQNVKVNLRYPAAGYGSLVTYVEIAVNQTSNQGSAIVSEGGIGQHFIGLTVNALNTYQMDYSVVIYGF